MCVQLDSSVSHVAKSAHICRASDLGLWVTGHCAPLLAQLHITGSRLWSRVPTFTTGEYLAFATALDTCWV